MSGAGESAADGREPRHQCEPVLFLRSTADIASEATGIPSDSARGGGRSYLRRGTCGGRSNCLKGPPIAISTGACLLMSFDVIQETLLDPGSFRPYSGPKLCGGYHADFAACLRASDGTEYWFLVCFGCHEVLCFSGSHELHCEMESDAMVSLEQAWESIAEAQERDDPGATRPYGRIP